MARKEDFEVLENSDRSSAKLSIIVGENLRQLRRKSGLSLEQLGLISGVSRAMLGQIETGKSAPTINLLGRVAKALKVSVPSLISSPGVSGTVIVPRDRATVVSSSEGGFVSCALFPWDDPQSIEIYEVTIGARHRELFAAQTAGAKKNLVVVSGTIEIVVGEDSPARLVEGDAILFNADTPHHFHNPGDNDAKAFLVVTGLDGSNSRSRQG